MAYKDARIVVAREKSVLAEMKPRKTKPNVAIVTRVVSPSARLRSAVRSSKATPALTANAVASAEKGSNCECGNRQSGKANFHVGKSNKTHKDVAYHAARCSRDHGSRDLTSERPSCMLTQESLAFSKSASNRKLKQS